jgi:hypothetical protein
MPRILVVADGPEHEVVLNEWVGPEHVASEHSASQLMERLAWGVQDAARAEKRLRRMFREERITGAASARSYLDLNE